MEKEYIRGLSKVIAATVLWGIGYPLWKLLSERIPPLPLTAMGFGFAAVVMFFAFKLRIGTLWKNFQAHAALILVLAISGGACGTGLLFFALSTIDTGIAAILEKLQPLFVLFFARIILHERCSAKKLPYMFGTLLSSFCIVNPDPFSFSFSGQSIAGLLAAVGASFFYGFNTVLSKFLVSNRISPRELVFFRMFFGSLSVLPLLLILPPSASALGPPDAQTLLLLLVASAISLVLAFDLFFSGLASVPAGTASFLELITPLIALLLGVSFLNEQLSTTQLFAIPAFLLCVYRVSRELPQFPPGAEISGL